MFLNFGLIIFIIAILSGCTTKQSNLNDIKDIVEISQDPTSYTNNIITLNKNYQKTLDKNFNKVYFKPWDQKKISTSKKEAMWGIAYTKREMYGQNYRKLNEQWFEEIVNNANFSKFNSNLKKAITVQNTNLRVLPTNKPMFLDPKEAGEGFPFDYNQNSSIYINTPIIISHYSKDKAWVFVESNFAQGWLSTKSIAILNNKTIKQFRNNNYAVAIKDNFPIYKNGKFIEYIKLGTIFPIRKNNFIIIGRDTKAKGFIRYIKIKILQKTY